MVVPVLLLTTSGSVLSSTGCGTSKRDAGSVPVARAATNGAAEPGGSQSVARASRPPSDYDADDEPGTHFGDLDYDDDRGQTDGDGDRDGPRVLGIADSDDAPIRAFGSTADAAKRAAVASLVRDYYDAAAKSDGAAACTVLYSDLAHEMAVNNSRPSTPGYLRGNTCAVVMTKLFRHNLSQMRRFDASASVTSVRVRGDRGFAIVHYEGLPDREFNLRREGKAWKLDSAIDRELS